MDNLRESLQIISCFKPYFSVTFEDHLRKQLFVIGRSMCTKYWLTTSGLNLPRKSVRR